MARSGAAASAAASAVVLLVVMALVQGSTAAKYAVGGTTGWQLPSSVDPDFYQNWERSLKPFFSTDLLEFTWLEPDSVLLVSLADFNACNTHSPIQAWPGSPGGLPTSMVFPLRGHQFSTLYFISGLSNNCGFGQKFSIDVSQ